MIERNQANESQRQSSKYNLSGPESQLSLLIDSWEAVVHDNNTANQQA